MECLSSLSFAHLLLTLLGFDITHVMTNGCVRRGQRQVVLRQYFWRSFIVPSQPWPFKRRWLDPLSPVKRPLVVAFTVTSSTGLNPQVHLSSPFPFPSIWSWKSYFLYLLLLCSLQSWKSYVHLENYLWLWICVLVLGWEFVICAEIDYVNLCFFHGYGYALAMVLCHALALDMLCHSFYLVCV